MLPEIYEKFKEADLVGHKRGRAGFLLKDTAKRRKRKINVKVLAEGPNPETEEIKNLKAECETLRNMVLKKDVAIDKCAKGDITMEDL